MAGLCYFSAKIYTDTYLQEALFLWRSNCGISLASAVFSVWLRSNEKQHLNVSSEAAVFVCS